MKPSWQQLISYAPIKIKNGFYCQSNNLLCYSLVSVESTIKEYNGNFGSDSMNTWAKIASSSVIECAPSDWHKSWTKFSLDIKLPPAVSAILLHLIVRVPRKVVQLIINDMSTWVQSLRILSIWWDLCVKEWQNYPQLTVIVKAVKLSRKGRALTWHCQTQCTVISPLEQQMVRQCVTTIQQDIKLLVTGDGLRKGNKNFSIRLQQENSIY